MNEIGHWLNLSAAHIQKRWEPYIYPTLVFFGLVFAATVIVVGVITVLPILLLISLNGQQDLLDSFDFQDFAPFIMPMIMIGITLIITTSVFGALIIFAPLQLRYLRGTLKLLRGESFEVGDLFRGLPGDAWRSVVLMLILAVMMTLSLLLLYIPAIFLGALFFFAMPIMADRGLGPIEALKASVEMTKNRLLNVILYSLLLSAIISFAGSIPIVGTMVSVPITTVMMMVAYQGVIGELPPPRDPAPPYQPAGPPH